MIDQGKYHNRSNCTLTFSKWSRKGYALFASLGKRVKIGHLSVDICSISILKTSAITSTTDSRLIYSNEDDIEEPDPNDKAFAFSIYGFILFLIESSCVLDTESAFVLVYKSYYKIDRPSAVVWKTTAEGFFMPFFMEKREITNLIEEIKKGYQITQSDVIKLLKHPDKEAFYEGANKLREYFSGDYFDLCSITNAQSGKCSEDCKWCAQSAHFKTGIKTYPVISPKEAIEEAVHNEAKGVKRYSLVTSGHSLKGTSFRKVLKIYESVAKETHSIKLCASLGLINYDQMIKLKERGVTSYHCNMETAPSFFHNLCSTHTPQEKIRTIKAAQKAGLKVCSGGIIGMGENMNQRVELAFTLRDLGIKSIPINILTPIEGTPLASTTQLTDEEVLDTFSIFRYINPQSQIRLAGGRSVIKHLEPKLLKLGVNASITGDLLTTSGSNIAEDKKLFEGVGFQFETNKEEHNG